VVEEEEGTNNKEMDRECKEEDREGMEEDMKEEELEASEEADPQGIRMLQFSWVTFHTT
jgi:hypothetical protein